MTKKRIIAETGAGQHGVATVGTLCSLTAQATGALSTLITAVALLCLGVQFALGVVMPHAEDETLPTSAHTPGLMQDAVRFAFALLHC